MDVLSHFWDGWHYAITELSTHALLFDDRVSKLMMSLSSYGWSNPWREIEPWPSSMRGVCANHLANGALSSILHLKWFFFQDFNSINLNKKQWIFRRQFQSSSCFCSLSLLWCCFRSRQPPAKMIVTADQKSFATMVSVVMGNDWNQPIKHLFAKLQVTDGLK